MLFRKLIFSFLFFSVLICNQSKCVDLSQASSEFYKTHNNAFFYTFFIDKVNKEISHKSLRDGVIAAGAVYFTVIYLLTHSDPRGLSHDAPAVCAGIFMLDLFVFGFAWSTIYAIRSSWCCKRIFVKYLEELFKDYDLESDPKNIKNPRLYLPDHMIPLFDSLFKRYKKNNNKLRLLSEEVKILKIYL